MTFHIELFTAKDRQSYLQPRSGETKLGEKILIPEKDFLESLAEAKRKGVRFALLGISEDIGQRGNLGRGGAIGAWDAFLSVFLNTQVNRYFDPSLCLLLGSVEVDDLVKKSEKASTVELRVLCEEIDTRVAPIIEELVLHEIEPVVIGGGHNNCFPILKGTSQAKGSKLAAINLDAHADFRALEGRHSGNGFRYAYDQSFLSAYTIVGLHESFNSEENLSALEAAGFPFITFEQTHVRRELSFDEAIESALEYLSKADLPVGLEIDADSIALMPASADSPYGYRISDAARLVHRVASSANCTYLHLSEGGPKLSPGDGKRHVGRASAFLALSYMKARISE